MRWKDFSLILLPLSFAPNKKNSFHASAFVFGLNVLRWSSLFYEIVSFFCPSILDGRIGRLVKRPAGQSLGQHRTEVSEKPKERERKKDESNCNIKVSNKYIIKRLDLTYNLCQNDSQQISIR